MAFEVLFVEDDTLFGESIEEFLAEEGYSVDWTTNASEALNFTFHKKYDLYLFDVKLPDMSGFDLLEELRKSGDMTPAIFLTSKNQKSDIKEGFLRGSDDYLTKPVDLEELLLRIRALLRRSYGEEVVQIEEFCFDIKNMSLRSEQKEIPLNPKEIKLLELFIKNRNKIVSKEQIFEYLWKPDEIVSEGALRVYINTLKKVFGKDAISNIRGVGYRFEK